jgi:hypothetical protein
MQKKRLFIPFIAVSLLLTPLSSLLSPIFAASPSPSVQPATTNINEVTENLKKRLQDSVDSPPATPTTAAARAYIGVVKDIIKDTVIIEDKDGKKDIKLEDSTTILRSPGNAVIKSDSIRIDDSVIAIGQLKDDVLMGQRLIVSTEAIKPPAKTSGIGTIIKINKADLLLKVGDNETTILYTAKTTLKSAAGIIEFSDLGVDDTLIYTATTDAKDKQTATVIMRILASSL